ncbi:MAG: DinB family protein [Bryobacteraceae bacterium]|nr:DinB family protein [Bryobacteraceae bacterium]
MKAKRDFVLRVLDRGAISLEQAAAGLSPSQWSFRPAGAWSILDVVEHVAVAEPALLEIIRLARPAEGRPPSDPSKDELTVERIAGRGRRVLAPAGLEPAGRFRSVDSALTQFHHQRVLTLEFVNACEADLRNLHTEHPILGLIPAFTGMLLLAAHPARHANQILEIRSTPGFPA